MPSEAFLRRMRAREVTVEHYLDPVETRERLGAVLMRSRLFGELWLALDPCALPELEAEESERPDPRPVLTADDVLRLRGKSDEAIQFTLEVCRAIPGARVLQ